jgi:hypothetical protein
LVADPVNGPAAALGPLTTLPTPAANTIAATPAVSADQDLRDRCAPLANLRELLDPIRKPTRTRARSLLSEIETHPGNRR